MVCYVIWYVMLQYYIKFCYILYYAMLYYVIYNI